MRQSSRPHIGNTAAGIRRGNDRDARGSAVCNQQRCNDGNHTRGGRHRHRPLRQRTDAFSFVFLRDVEAGTVVNFTDNGWLASGGFRSGENTVTYTASAAITAGTVVTLTGLDLDAAGDQIIAYQGDPATPTILHLVDFGDGNNTVAGDATNDNTTALPPGFTLGVNAVAVAFDSSLYAGPISGSPEGLFAALNNSANWFDSDALPVAFNFDARPIIDLDSDNSTAL